MLAYIVRRLFWALALLLAMTLITFVVFFVIPSDRSRVAFRTGRGEYDIRQSVGLSGTVWSQYGQYVWHLVHGNFGRSFRAHDQVRDILVSSAPVTASVVVGGAVVWLLISLPLGVLAAIRPRSLLDRAATIFVLIGISVHPIWIGLIFLYVFGFKLSLFPLGQYCEVFNPPPGATCGGLVQWAWHLVLPWVTFALLFAALYVRMVRASVLESYDEDYVRTARAKGASEFRVLRGHVLRNALLPVVSMLGMDMAIAMGGTLFVEQVYGLPGLGKTVVRGLQTYDLPIILGVVVIVTASIVVLNLIVDLLYGLLDPRVRFSRVDAEEELAAPALAEPAPKAAPAEASI